MSDAHPYDRDDFDAGLRVLLRILRKRPVQDPEELDEDDREDRARVMAALPDMPPPAQAFVHAALRHGSYHEVSWHQLTDVRSTDDHDPPGVAQALGQAGWSLDRSIVIGTSGGGEVQLLLCWTDESYAIVKVDLEDGTLTRFGDFTGYFTGIARYEWWEREVEREDMDEELLAIIDELGVSDVVFAEG